MKKKRSGPGNPSDSLRSRLRRDVLEPLGERVRGEIEEVREAFRESLRDGLERLPDGTLCASSGGRREPTSGRRTPDQDGTGRDEAGRGEDGRGPPVASSPRRRTRAPGPPRTQRGPAAREAVFRFVRERLLAGEPPTVREVRDAVGFSAVESARAHLEALVAEGRLEKESGESRGYRLPSAGRRGTHPPVLVPLLGRVAAGAPILAAEHTEGWLSVQPRRAGEALFALRVRGDSMVNAGILDGDIVVVRSRETAEDGRIVVAQVGDGEQAEATVKRFRRGRGGRVELHPENAAYPVLVPPPGNVRILGQVVEVRRFLEGGEGAITGHDAPPGSWPAGVREDGPDGAGREDGPDGPDGEDRANDPGGRGGPDRRDTGASPAGQRPRDGGTRP